MVLNLLSTFEEYDASLTAKKMEARKVYKIKCGTVVLEEESSLILWQNKDPAFYWDVISTSKARLSQF